MKIKEFFDEPTFTLTYLIFDEESRQAAIIDPVLNYDQASSKVSKESLEELIEVVSELNLEIRFIIETHAHADHLTSAQFLKEKYPSAVTVIHEDIRVVQESFKSVFNFDNEFDTSGKVFDQLVKEGDSLSFEGVEIEVIHTPGHTPACMSLYVNKSVVFTGDALFMPDFGTGRCDFPKGSAEDLYNSIHEKLYRLPDETEVYVGHDYQPGGRELAFKSTIGEQKRNNIQLKFETTKEEYVRFRTSRDKTLKAPKLLLPSIQINAQNGRFPKPESNGVSYLKMPLKINS